MDTSLGSKVCDGYHSLGSKEFMMATTLRSEGGQSDIEHITYKVLHGLKILNTSGMKWAP